jgi:hypothetical protein
MQTPINSMGLSTTSASSQAQKPPLVLQSPNPWSQLSQPSNTRESPSDTIEWGIDTIEWVVNPSEGGSSTPNSAVPSSAVPSPAVMTKEEKALEMTKRKEERKQVCF